MGGGGGREEGQQASEMFRHVINTEFPVMKQCCCMIPYSLLLNPALKVEMLFNFIFLHHIEYVVSRLLSKKNKAGAGWGGGFQIEITWFG